MNLNLNKGNLNLLNDKYFLYVIILVTELNMADPGWMVMVIEGTKEDNGYRWKLHQEKYWPVIMY